MTRPRTLTDMAAKQGPNERLTTLGWRLEKQSAMLVTLALVVIDAELTDNAPYVGSGDPTKERVSGGGRMVLVPADDHGPAEMVPVTSVEAAAMRTDSVRALREAVRDKIDAVVAEVKELDDLCRRIAGPQARDLPPICDGRARGYDGHMLAWSPQAKGPNRGWHDPTCRDIAGPTGLCPRCLVRMNRWRSDNDLAAIGVERAA